MFGFLLLVVLTQTILITVAFVDIRKLRRKLEKLPRDNPLDLDDESDDNWDDEKGGGGCDWGGGGS